MISPSRSPGRRRTARWLATAALGGLAVTATAAVQARAATLTVQARTAGAQAATGLAMTLHPIAVNTKNWTGKAGFGSRRPAWYSDRSGAIHLQGAAKQTNSITATAPKIGVLPAAARPAHTIYTIAHSFNGTFADIEIDTAGDIFAIVPAPPAVRDFSFVSLEGITYRPSGNGSQITLNTTNWTAPPPGTGTRPPASYFDGGGVVHLQGAASQISTSGTSANVIGVLPVPERPARDLYFVVNAGEAGYADLAIDPNGTINLIDPRPPAAKDYFLVSLESISYAPSGVGTAIALNTANWSPNAGFASRGPAWYNDNSGVFHLQGAVTQASASGTSPNLIGTLPAAVAPRHTVYTIVHTFNGTYADLAIQPNGQIGLIDPRPPMVKDYTFVSLEGITYRR
jgi:hypothetical protein